METSPDVTEQSQNSPSKTKKTNNNDLKIPEKLVSFNKCLQQIKGHFALNALMVRDGMIRACFGKEGLKTFIRNTHAQTQMFKKSTRTQGNRR